MPFIGKDWRSPGEAWVKTSDGWERKKIIEHSLLSTRSRYLEDKESLLDNSLEEGDDEQPQNDNVYPYDDISTEILCNPLFKEWQPHCQITLKNTKEVAGYNLISEAFQQLDFRNAVHDIRRFNYICKLLHLLISQNLTALSGRATQVMFNMLEEVAWQVASDQQNIHILHMLLTDLKKYLKKYFCWGRPLGSTALWKQHLQTISRICNVANTIEIKGPIEDGRCQLGDLPTEVIREILLRLNDHKDLENSAQAYHEMKHLLEEQHIWRELCRFHFTHEQLRTVVGDGLLTQRTKVDWKDAFHSLRKRYGLREEYPDCLLLCRYCRCLFWKSFGHPCVEKEELANRRLTYHSPDGAIDNGDHLKSYPRLYTPVPPQAFLQFFSL